MSAGPHMRNGAAAMRHMAYWPHVRSAFGPSYAIGRHATCRMSLSHSGDREGRVLLLMAFTTQFIFLPSALQQTIIMSPRHNIAAACEVWSKHIGCKPGHAVGSSSLSYPLGALIKDMQQNQPPFGINGPDEATQPRGVKGHAVVRDLWGAVMQAGRLRG